MPKVTQVSPQWRGMTCEPLPVLTPGGRQARGERAGNPENLFQPPRMGDKGSLGEMGYGGEGRGSNEEWPKEHCREVLEALGRTGTREHIGNGVWRDGALTLPIQQRTNRWYPGSYPGTGHFNSLDL